jgi:hypothetical protein
VSLILEFKDAEATALRVRALSHFSDNSRRPDIAEADILTKARSVGTREGKAETAAPPPDWDLPTTTAAPPSPPAPAPQPPGEARRPAQTIPQFPWPPPLASATGVIPRSLLPSPQDKLLMDVDRRLVSALDACGYVGKSYYAVPDGFALVTQIEQINSNGSSKKPPDRWSAELGSVSSFSLSSYLEALFTANPGRYRVIVFVVTSHPFSQSDVRVSKEEAFHWLATGLNQLPPAIGAIKVTDSYSATALIYEFEEPRTGEQAKFVEPSALTYEDHLKKSNLWAALEK